MVWKSERWNELVESSNIEGKHVPIDPQEISIKYARGSEAEKTEVVYEDLTEATQPRLLVSLSSVLKMKEMCEHEHARCDRACETLTHCRTAYYKELRWLRDMLKQSHMQQCDRARRRVSLQVNLQEYEVYWFEPPHYIDDDLKVFLQTCIRETNKKLIQEVQDLRDQLNQDDALRENARAGLTRGLDMKVGMEEMEKKLEAEQLQVQRTVH